MKNVLKLEMLPWLLTEIKQVEVLINKTIEYIIKVGKQC